jgi:hypothetical protein
MGQLALGLRSLFLRFAIFFVLAAALAWALGGTLFPRPERVDGPRVEFAGREWFVRLSAGGEHPGEARYELMVVENGEKPTPVGGMFADAGEIVVSDGSLHVPMRSLRPDGGAWVMRTINAERVETIASLDDRLAAEEELARLRRAP